jgi:hypothetical protein
VKPLAEGAEATRQHLLKAYSHPVHPAQSLTGLGIAHALWLLIQILDGTVRGDKGQRWLGYAHALMVVEGCASLDQLRDLMR